MYIRSCANCKIEYQFKGLFAKRKLNRFWNECLYCGMPLSVVPLRRNEEIKELEVEKGFFKL